MTGMRSNGVVPGKSNRDLPSMRPLRAVLSSAAILCVLNVSLTPRAVAAQETWNDERTKALVSAAIQRRAVQLADTGLADYTARAHGYLTFLAQLGEGFPEPPKLIKSDELVVEVYWGAPDRSKQRVVGRRDTLLLPTDIKYHRDHLGVVQNNFPEIIRLGDGDEVRDVPHPLSARGLQTYDYAISDSLAIRTSDRAIDVMMVKVRPKDDGAAAAVGAVYIDRVTGSVVRMTLSFTRAALKDKQLEDVSVILENGLVDGRFWLPRRQEIEIRRSASWMDFPARGIIRGRWEICCVRTNVGLPPATFIGAEISEAPLEAQRAYPFEGTILGTLPDEVRALDAEEVRRVQDEARDLVRAGALARARSTSPATRGISDVVRVNRAEGFALGAGLTQRLGRGFSARAAARYGSSDDDAKLRGEVEWRSRARFAVTVGGFDDFMEAGDAREVSGLRNSIAAQEFGSDWTDPYGARGAFVRVERTLSGASAPRLSLELGRQSDRPLAVRARPATGRYEPTIAADSVHLWRATLGWSHARAVTASATRWEVSARLTGARVAWQGGAVETGDHLRASFDAEGQLAAGNGQLVWRTVAAAVSSGAPEQSAVFFGGPVTAPGYDFHSLRGRVGVSQRIEWQSRIPFVALDLGRFGKVPSTLTLAPWVHAVWIDGRGPTTGPGPGSLNRTSGGWWPSAGVGVLGLFDLLRLDVGKATRGGWLVSIDVARDLWPVL